MSDPARVVIVVRVVMVLVVLVVLTMLMESSDVTDRPRGGRRANDGIALV